MLNLIRFPVDESDHILQGLIPLKADFISSGICPLSFQVLPYKVFFRSVRNVDIRIGSVK